MFTYIQQLFPPFADLICARRLPFAALRLFDQSRRAGLILPGNFEIDALTACCMGSPRSAGFAGVNR